MQTRSAKKKSKEKKKSPEIDLFVIEKSETNSRKIGGRNVRFFLQFWKEQNYLASSSSSTLLKSTVSATLQDKPRKQKLQKIQKEKNITSRKSEKINKKKERAKMKKKEEGEVKMTVTLNEDMIAINANYGTENNNTIL